MDKNKPTPTSRRDFLKKAGIAGATAGVAAVALKTDKVAADVPEQAKASGYRETEHVNTYYALSRF